jgi:hypothetical protein
VGPLCNRTSVALVSYRKPLCTSRNVGVSRYNSREHPPPFDPQCERQILAGPAPRAEREDDQTTNDGALVLENRSTSIPGTGTKETSIGRLNKF